MLVEFDIKCTVNLNLPNKEYHNKIKHMSNEELIEILNSYLDSCALTCEVELSKDGYFDNIQVSQISINKD